MLKKILAISFVIIALFFFERAFYFWIMQDDLRTGIFYFSIFTVIPIFIWLIFNLILRNSKQLKYVNLFILILNITIIAFLISIILNGIDYSYFRKTTYKIKEKRAKSAVKNWLDNNLTFPSSVKYFGYSTLKISKANDHFNIPSYYFIDCGIMVNDNLILGIELMDNNKINYEGGLTFQLNENYEVLNTVSREFISKNNNDTTKNNIKLVKQTIKNNVFRKQFCYPLINLELEFAENGIGYYRHVEFDDNKEVKSISEMRNGEMNGWHIHVFNGKDTLKAVYYVDGKVNGIYKEFYQNGQLTYLGFKNDSGFVGKCTSWFCNGIKKAEGMKLNNKKQGEWKFWDSKGTVVATVNYKNDSLID